MNMKKLFHEFVALVLEGDERIKRGGTPADWRSNRDEAFEMDIEALLDEPEFKSVDAFVNYKLDNDEYSFSTAELQALARNSESQRLGRKAQVASLASTSALKQNLIDDFGFKFEPRQATQFKRGSMSSSHGSHPFAGSGGGGTGFGSDFSGATFTSYGGGPGAIGGGYAWRPEDKKNLPMGSKRGK